RQGRGIRAMYDFTYQKPASLADAVNALKADADARALAGGMTYIPVLKQRLAKPSTIVDLSGLGLTGINVAGGVVTIGAMTTHVTVASSDMVKSSIPGLANPCRIIAEVAARDRGTISGSTGNKGPA